MGQTIRPIRHGNSATTRTECRATPSHPRLRRRARRRVHRFRRVLSPSLRVVPHSRTAHIELGILVTAYFFSPTALGLRALLAVAVSSPNLIVTKTNSIHIRIYIILPPILVTTRQYKRATQDSRQLSGSILQNVEGSLRRSRSWLPLPRSLYPFPIPPIVCFRAVLSPCCCST
ncbi:hypothetical protein K466DRAFT_409841 [Polyporus arcularius HHB13444]|uniref:Uncharacterized protein n=1 Tax=Polyporus arcularius HHB13444 TaxID=1314778 RepID=A0A5C3PL60_9APHY|nr:hypothetical protein K466DRAFT_409841 [Polyporus arcularius HHB13444]